MRAPARQGREAQPDLAAGRRPALQRKGPEPLPPVTPGLQTKSAGAGRPGPARGGTARGHSEKTTVPRVTGAERNGGWEPLSPPAARTGFFVPHGRPSLSPLVAVALRGLGFVVAVVDSVGTNRRPCAAPQVHLLLGRRDRPVPGATDTRGSRGCAGQDLVLSTDFPLGPSRQKALVTTGGRIRAAACTGPPPLRWTVTTHCPHLPSARALYPRPCEER